jgi:hypothetical protein
MKSFVIAWFVAFGLVTLIASGVTWFVSSRPVSPRSEALLRQATAVAAESTPSTPFTPAEAVDVVAARLPGGASGRQSRERLHSASSVSYHSPQHWRVCVDDACWVAHGPGRYAEPENDAARQREARTSLPR